MQYNEDSSKKSFKENIKQIFKNFWYDFIHAFKYNNMKLPAILFAIPGLLIGFFISFHYDMIVDLPNTYLEFYPASEVELVSTDDGGYTFTLNNFTIYATVNGHETEQVISATFKGKPEEVLKNKYKGDYQATAISGAYDKSEFNKLTLSIDSNERADGSFGGSLTYELNDQGKRTISLKYNIAADNANKLVISLQKGIEAKKVVPFDFSAISVFFLMLISILNIFLALSLSSKKNLGSVVLATISTVIMFVFAGLYFFAIFTAYNAVSSGLIVDTWVWTTQKNFAILSIILSLGFAVAGVVLSWLFYDRTYQKVDR